MSSPTLTPRLLVVEHDASLSLLLETLLREEGFAVVTASSVKQALALTQEQVFNVIFTALFPRGQQEPLASLEPLRLQTHPTPIGLISDAFVSQAEAQQRGYAAVLELPFRIEDVLRALSTCLNRLLSPEHAQQAQLISRFLDAVGRGEWEVVRRLCLPTLWYAPLTPGLFTTKALHGIEDYVAYAQTVHQQLPGFHIEHAVVFKQQGRLVTRVGCSWHGREGQRLALAGSVLCRFAGERISQIGVSFNRHRLRALLAETRPG